MEILIAIIMTALLISCWVLIMAAIFEMTHEPEPKPDYAAYLSAMYAEMNQLAMEDLTKTKKRRFDRDRQGSTTKRIKNKELETRNYERENIGEFIQEGFDSHAGNTHESVPLSALPKRADRSEGEV
jgi:hypothetical protein